MGREGAETYLRLLAEAAMRGSLPPAAAPRAPNASTIMAAGHALTAVGALDPVTAEEILTDFRLAVTVRQLHHEPAGQGVTAAGWLTPPAGAEPRVSVSDTKLSPGEHLLVMLAERLLTGTPEFPRRGLLAAPPTSPRQVVAGGFGVIIAALEAAGVLSPLSPVPARLATLCASLDLTGHGIAAPPTPDLPEPWLSLLAHYRRRKPEPTQMHEGYVALATRLPELDGIRVNLLGLQHTQGGSSLHVLVQGRIPEPRPGPLDIDLNFPLSLWLRDSGGRWHAARPDRCHQAGRERAIRLRLVPPLTRPADWVEVLAGGRSAEVRATLPLRWRYLS